VKLPIGHPFGVPSPPGPFADDAETSPKASCFQPAPEPGSIATSGYPLFVEEGQPDVEGTLADAEDITALAPYASP